METSHSSPGASIATISLSKWLRMVSGTGVWQRVSTQYATPLPTLRNRNVLPSCVTTTQGSANNLRMRTVSITYMTVAAATTPAKTSWAMGSHAFINRAPAGLPAGLKLPGLVARASRPWSLSPPGRCQHIEQQEVELVDHGRDARATRAGRGQAVAPTAGSVSSFRSVTITSVVSISPATEAALMIALLATRAGSMMPPLTRSV